MSVCLSEWVSFCKIFFSSKMDKIRKFGEQTSWILEFKPQGLVINYLRLFLTETPFERYLYFIAFKHSRGETPEYLKFFSSYIDTTPAWEGTGDNSDVLHPSLVASLDYPYFYNHTYVHFLPGGYVNSKTVRMSYLGNSKFTFLNETYVDQW